MLTVSAEREREAKRQSIAPFACRSAGPLLEALEQYAHRRLFFLLCSFCKKRGLRACRSAGRAGPLLEALERRVLNDEVQVLAPEVVQVRQGWV